MNKIIITFLYDRLELISSNPSTKRCIVIPPVVICHAEFALAHFTAPLDRLGNGAGGCYGAIGGVGVGGGDVAG